MVVIKIVCCCIHNLLQLSIIHVYEIKLWKSSYCYRESVALFFGVLWILDSRYICWEVENSWALISGHTHWASNSKIAGSNPAVVIWCSVLCTYIDKALYEIYTLSQSTQLQLGTKVMLGVNLWWTGVRCGFYSTWC